MRPVPGPSAQVSVTATPGALRVEVRQGSVTTSHEVTVPAGLPEELGFGPGGEEDLVRAAFGFLLEREPATSILRRFDLTVIGDYFPEFPDAVRRQA